MENVPAYGLANTATAFAPLFSGVFALLYCWLLRRQPARWTLVYWLIVLTGVFTLTLHGYGQTNPVWGQRWFWSFLDTGSNIVVTWAITLAILGDFYGPKTRRWASPLATLGMVAGVAWHYYDRLPSTGRRYVVPLGKLGGFYPGEFTLILFAWATVILFFMNWKRIHKEARPLLILTALTFFVGMILATATDELIVPPFLAVHAIWHVVAAFGFMTLWAFNHARFSGNGRGGGIAAF